MTNLLLLPDEVKIKIIDYLDGVDKLQLLKVCKDLYRIGVDREVIQCLNFTNNFKLTLGHIKYMARKLTCHLVTNLNITGIHWIPSAQLKNTLIKFINLSSLHVIDTQLSYRDLTVVLSNTNKVRKLGFSLRPDNCADVFKVQIQIPITHLYVTYNSYSIRALINLLTQFTEMQELWIIEPNVPFDIIINDEMPWTAYASEKPLPKVTKRIILSRKYCKIPDKNVFLNTLKKENINWVTLCDIHSNDYIFTAYENLNTTNKLLNSDEILNRIQNEFGMTNIFSIKDIKLMLHGDFTNRYYNSLNLVQESATVSNIDLSLSKKTFEAFLLSEKTKKLKQLKCESFPFWETFEEEKIATALFKKPRIGVSVKKADENSLFVRFTKHTIDLEDFEIIDNNDRAIREKVWNIESLSFVANWKILKKLTITSVNFINGKFLTTITKNCPMLKSLKIKDDVMQDNISANLCEALRYANNLKDLRYERKGGIPVDQLFESLTQCQRLERLYVQCRFASKISKKPLESVIALCQNLVFLFIYISELPETVCKSIKQSINEFGVKPQQLINIRGTNYTLRNIIYEDIPTNHIQDMVCQSSNFHCDFLKSFHC